MSNSVGVIDSGYRGEIMCKFKNAISFNTFFENNLNSEINTYGVGERVAQIMIIPIPEITFEEVDELSDSERGTDGHGSSGK
jgi:dUTP pyrophosphatase